MGIFDERDRGDVVKKAQERIEMAMKDGNDNLSDYPIRNGDTIAYVRCSRCEHEGVINTAVFSKWKCKHCGITQNENKKLEAEKNG